MFDVELFEQEKPFSLSEILKKRETFSGSELNVLLITKPLSVSIVHNDFNQILDATIRTFSDQQVSLFESQKPLSLGLGLSYSMRHSNANLTFNFTYREIPGLKDPESKKLNLQKTSLLVVLA